MLKNRVLCQYNATAIHHNRARFADIAPLRWYRYGATADTKLRDNYNILQIQSQVGFSPAKFALGFLGGSVASKIGLESIKRLSHNPKAREVLERIKQKNDKLATMKSKFKIQQTLKKYNVENLNLATKDEYKSFVDSGLSKNYKTMPNILKIAHINKDLQNTLGLKDSAVFLTKKHFSHFRKERKQEFKQDVPDEFLYKMPKVIEDSTQAYVDMKNNNFFIATPIDNDNLAFLHFNVDELGNFIVTAKKATKEDLNKKEYGKVKANVERNRTLHTAISRSSPN